METSLYEHKAGLGSFGKGRPEASVRQGWHLGVVHSCVATAGWEDTGGRAIHRAL